MFTQPDFNNYQNQNKKRLKRVAILILILLIIGYAAFQIGSSISTIEITNDMTFWQKFTNIFSFNADEPADKDYVMPDKEENRFDILLLGIRGDDDPNAKDGGPLLTDTIMILSYDKTLKKASLISLPRDLYVKINKNKKDKINAAYEYGFYNNEGIDFIKELISKITGIYIDKVIVINFSEFEKIIDEIGGIDITLTKPFEESGQWGYVFKLPTGVNHLNGQDALYYARSRYSSSDFDRSRRQQQVIFATKDKLTKLDFWSNPIKTLTALNTVRNSITTDLNIWSTGDLLNLAKEINDSAKITKYVISTENFVYESRVDNSYVLLPNGNNFDQIKQFFKNIFQNNPPPTGGPTKSPSLSPNK